MGLTRADGGSEKRRRFRFSLNGLAIQLAAFALSSTLVALLVVSGSQAAFVEPSEALADYVDGRAEPTDEPAPAGRRPSAQPPVPAPASPGTTAAEVPVPQTLAAIPPEPEEPVPAATVVELSDSDAGTAMFGVETVLIPGARTDRCIEVVYAGDGGLPVLLYAVGTRGDLGPFLNLTIEVGPGGNGTFGGCSGFVPTSTVFSGTLAGFVDAHSTYATGRQAWTPEEDRDSRAFRFGLTLRDDPASSGRSVTFGFTWESRDIPR